MFVFCVWCLCAFVCNQLARQKGRDTFGWTILGFLLGVFAVVALLVLPPLNK